MAVQWYSEALMNQRHKRPRRFLRSIVVVVACWVGFSWRLGSTAVQAAEPSKAPPQSSAVSAPVAIADSEIIPRAEQTIKLLQKIKSEVTADPTLKSIQTDFAALVQKSDRRRESEVETVSKSRSVQDLNEMLREWSLEQSQLDHWNQALLKTSQILAAQGKDIGQIIETWSATQSAVAKKFFFKAVLERRVEEVLLEAQATRLVVQE